MMIHEFSEFDGLALAALIARGEMSAEEVVQSALNCITKVDPTLNSVVRLDPEGALRVARNLPKGRPFGGVPFLLKDFLAMVAGEPTSSGAAFLKDFIAPEDSVLVRRYREAGFIILGRTNTPEMAISASTEPRLFGATRNPWDSARSAGGSSGGSAAAVAARMVPVAHATDGGGSIRIPASACGLVGLKPSRGRNSMAPLMGESLGGAAAEHVVARSVRDCAAVLDCTAGPAPGDPYAAPAPTRPFLAETDRPAGRLRVAVSVAPPYPCDVAPECRAALAAAAALCADLGHIVEEATPAIDAELLDQAFLTAMTVNIASTVALRAQGRSYGPEDFEPVTWAMIEHGRARSGVDYLRAIQAFHRIGRQAAPFFQTYDVLLTPTLATLPPPLGWLDIGMSDLDGFLNRLFSFAPYTRVWNATGQPAISLPLHWTGAGLPVGVQFVGRANDEATLLRLAAELERAAPWAKRRPKLP